MTDDRPPLTDRQLQVAKLIVAGMETKQIAADLGISRQAVECHIAAIVRRWSLDHDRDARIQIAQHAA